MTEQRYCPHCGKPNLTGSQVCSYCGRSMDGTAGTARPVTTSVPGTRGTAARHPTPPAPPVPPSSKGYTAGHAAGTPHSSKASHPAPAPPVKHSSGASSSASRPAPVPPPAPVKSSTSAPVPVPTPPGVPMPFRGGHAAPVPAASTSSSTSAPWGAAPVAAASTPIPRSLLRFGGPSLQGVIEDVRDLQIAAQVSWGARSAKNTVSTLLFFTKPLLLITGWLFRGASNKPTDTHWVIGVRRADGTKAQARIEGDLTGSILSRGDYVSLWGGKRSGVFIVRRGFNHTVSAEIRIRKR